MPTPTYLLIKSNFKRRYLHPSSPIMNIGNTTLAVIGRCHIVPIDVPWKCSVDRIIYQVGAASAGNVRAAIYREGATIDRADGGRLIVESASVAQAAVTGVQMITITETVLQAGRYYLALQGDDVTGTCQGNYDMAFQFGHLYNLGAYGAFTDPCPATALQTRHPVMWLRVARNLL